MDDEALRLECLRLACQAGGYREDVLRRARAYTDFVLGTKDAEVVQAARELAAKVKAV